MEIKMIVTDLDGTLLKEDKTISARTISTFNKCREAGIKTAYATGRCESADDLTDGIVFDGRVNVNGAVAHAGSELVYSSLFHINTVREMLLAVDAAGHEIIVQRKGDNFSNIDFRYKWPWLKYTPADFKNLDTEIEKIYAEIESSEALTLIKKHLPEGLYCSVARDGVAMIMRNEATKSNAVAALAKHWGINVKNIAAFGDDLNDLDLLELCGMAVVTENALDEAKAAADEICGSNENDGVAVWIEENILRIGD